MRPVLIARYDPADL